MTEPSILLTNDDGIDAAGLASLYEELTGVADVTVVAPVENKSGTGRTRTHRTTREAHPWGYAIDGTPADCVAYGFGGLDTDFDLVVSGCNHGPNAGNYVVGRSGTVGACIEAAFLGIPGIAVSAYHAQDFFVHPPESYDFGRPARVARELVVRTRGGTALDDADVLNVNVPVDAANPRMRLTEPHHDYEVRVEHAAEDREETPIGAREDGDIALRDVVWPGTVGWENPFPVDETTRDRYPEASDRRALIDGDISVSPLTAPALAVETTALDGIVAAYNESETARERGRDDDD